MAAAQLILPSSSITGVLQKSADDSSSLRMGYAGEARKPMRRHWKDDPGAYSPEELKKLKEEDDGERQ